MLEQIDLAIGFAVVMLLLSLISMVIVQAVAAVFDLRGRNLVWGITKLLHQVDPEFKEKVKRDWNEAESTIGKEIAEAVTKHPAIAHSWLGRATAIRLDELTKILRDIAKRPSAEIDATALEKLKKLATEMSPNNPTSREAADLILRKVESKTPALSADLKGIINQEVGAGNRLENGFREWFDTMMDRSSDSFARYTRMITVAAAVLLAFGLHIDSGSLLHQISSNTEIRGRLAGAADQTLKKTDQVINDGKRGTTALTAFREKHKTEPVAAAITEPLPDLATCLDAQRWFSTRNATRDSLDDLDTICHDEVADSLKQAQTTLKDLRADLDHTGLRILTADFPSSISRGGVAQFFRESYKNSSQLPGLFCTAILLSLGAPFWYNALRQLASLKPPIAQKIKSEQSPHEQ